MQSRINLQFSPTLSHANSWRPCIHGHAIEARIRVASTEEHVVTIELRRSAVRERYDSRHYLRVLDGDTFLVASAQYTDDTPRIELALTRAPEAINEVMRAIP